MDAAMEVATGLKAIANRSYHRNKMLIRQPTVDAIMPTLEVSTL
jgi:enoyl-CoA hydratase